MQRFAQTIRVGGTVRAADLAALAESISLVQCSDVQEVTRLHDETDAQYVSLFTQDDNAGCIRLEDAESSGGTFDGLVATCRDLGLPYDLYSGEGGDPYEPLVSLWRPGMPGPVAYGTAGYMGDIAVERAPLAAILSRLREEFTEGGVVEAGPRGWQRKFPHDEVLALIVELEAALGMDVPDLTAFEIEGVTTDGGGSEAEAPPGEGQAEDDG